MSDARTNEQAYFDALRTIASFMSPARIRKEAYKTYGLDFEDALVMAYENVIEEAKRAIKGHRRPTLSKPRRNKE